MILVTAANGQLGSAIIEQLQQLTADPLIAGVRQPESYQAPVGVSVRTFDYDDRDGMAASLAGVDRLLFISGTADNETRIAQHRRVVDAARSAGVERVIYTSYITAPVADSAFPFSAIHADTEHYLRESGLEVVLLRNGFYAENLQPAFNQALASGQWADASQSGRIAPVSRADLAEASARVALLENPKPVYSLSGNEALSFEALVAVAAEISGQTLQYVALPVEKMSEIYQQIGLPPFLAEAIAHNARAIDNGEYAEVSDDLNNLLGRPAQDLRSLFRRWLPA